jgi:AraC-like DNA-binding protein
VLWGASEHTDGALPWSAPNDRRLARVIETILTHPEQHPTLGLLGSVVHVSRSTFAQCLEQ